MQFATNVQILSWQTKQGVTFHYADAAYSQVERDYMADDETNLRITRYGKSGLYSFTFYSYTTQERFGASGLTEDQINEILLKDDIDFITLVSLRRERYPNFWPSDKTL